ncbi:MAG: hypothetical protein JSW48_07860 [Betaproteobacteria bacterium]|nr:MAG: hypothetical protein JSW48_07860 [Betaproteobacteria bacterium]
MRRKPKSIEGVIPSRDKPLEMMVRAQQAGASLAPAGWLVGLVFDVIAMLFDGTMGSGELFLLGGRGLRNAGLSARMAGFAKLACIHGERVKSLLREPRCVVCSLTLCEYPLRT